MEELSTNLFSSNNPLYTGNGKLIGEAVNVNGHSLGGHLGMAFSRLFSGHTNDVTAINGLGFKIGDRNVYNLIAELRGISGLDTVPGFEAGKIENVYGIAGWEFAAMNNGVLQQPGGWDGAYIESIGLPVSGGHSAVQMTDSLAVYDLFIRLDSSLASKTPTEALTQLKPLFEAGSNQRDHTLESLVAGLSQTILGTKPEIAIDDREALYAAIKTLTDSPAFQSLIGKVTLSTALPTAAEARTDLGAFLSLYYLTPFTLQTGDAGALNTLYNANSQIAGLWNDDRNLTQDEIKQGQANFSDKWLEDRAAMLSWINQRNTSDTPDGQYISGPEQIFVDKASNTTIYVGSGHQTEANMRHFSFGGDGSDPFEGGNLSDRLYGGGGDDNISGGGDKDYLEGGTGGDHLSGGDGTDELLGGADDDVLNGDEGNDTLVGGSGLDTLYGGGDADLVYGDDQDGKLEGGRDYLFGQAGNDTLLGGGGQDTLDGGDDADTLYGDLEDFANTQVVGDDEIHGGKGEDTLHGGGGKDKLYGDDGQNTLHGDAGNDTLTGGSLRDVMDGGDDNDKLQGLGQDDALQGGKGQDTLIGGSGGDMLIGGDDADTLWGDGEDGQVGEGDINADGGDFLQGGGGDDKLHGGGGSDLLDGGAGYDEYHSGAGDTIIDSDGAGAVWYAAGSAESKLGIATRKKGETVYLDKAGNRYLEDGPNLIINDSLAITQYQDGKLGIYLKEEEEDNNNGGGNNNNFPIPRNDYKKARNTTSPLALDLDGDGIVETTPANSGTYFDHGADGFAEDTGWIGADDGLLVRDLNGNGRIDSGRELFGNQTLLANGRTAANGFDALKPLDGNRDGKVDASDAAFGSLMIWRDSDGDGYASAGELHTLAELGIQSIGTAYNGSTAIDPNNNAHKQTGTYTTTAGQSHKADDVWFDADKSDTLDQTWVAIPEDIAALPDLQGYGTLHGLRQAMARDETGQIKGVVADGARRGLRSLLRIAANGATWKETA